MVRIAVIIVTHNSQEVLPLCMKALEQYGDSCVVVLVDCGSDDTLYLKEYEAQEGILVIYEKNIGFGQANNLGYQRCSDIDFIVFLNPDAIITEQTFGEALQVMADNFKAGCLGGRLLGYDLKAEKPKLFIDSTGIFRKWYGRWFDRGQGELDTEQYTRLEVIPAACAAFLFCRREMIEELSLVKGVFFDPDFFLYKEDIEIGLRIRKSRWDTLYAPSVKVYHCRGWKQRNQISRQSRLTAAANEILLYRKHPSPYIVWAFFKYVLVRFFRI